MRTISQEELRTLLESRSDALVLDVRVRKDYDADSTMLPHATWRDPEQIEQWSLGLPADQEIVVYCARGRSVSNAVIDKLLSKGLQARYLEGGIEAWKQAGGETIRKT